MASSRALLSFRVFMRKEIIPELRTPEDLDSLAYLTDMSLPDSKESKVRFITKMEMQDKFSASNVLPLVEMLKNMQRNDLSKKVERFHKMQKKKKKKDVADHPAADDIYQTCDSLQIQSETFLEQMKEFHTIVCNMGHTAEVERDIITDAIAIFREFQDRLQLGLRKMQQLRQESVYSLDSTSPQSLSSDDMQSPPGTLEREMRQRSGDVSKTKSIPKDIAKRKQPMMPPVFQPIPIAVHIQDTEEHVYEYVTARTSFSPPQGMLTHYSSAGIQEENRKQTAVSQDKTPNQAAKLKPPTVARKPTKYNDEQNSMRDVTSSLDTSTGDSGFVDSKQFRKECPPSVQPRHKYTPLKAEQREAVSCYATPEPKDEIYDDVSYGDKSQYVNYPTK